MLYKSVPKVVDHNKDNSKNMYFSLLLRYQVPLVSSDRSSCSDDGLLYIQQRQRQQLFQIFTQSLDTIDVTSVTLSPLNSINAIDVTRYY